MSAYRLQSRPTPRLPWLGTNRRADAWEFWWDMPEQTGDRFEDHQSGKLRIDYESATLHWVTPLGDWPVNFHRQRRSA